MKKRVKKSSPWKIAAIILFSIAALLLFFFIIPVILLFDGEKLSGNIALIPVNGVLTVNGESYLGQNTVSSQNIVEFIEDAEESPMIQGILIEINSPGGSAVASDEIGQAVKKTSKPVVAVIREVGASGGYWVASSAEHIIANRMSITGSVGVISSYLEFSQLLNQYNITYQRLVAGNLKDIGTPMKELEDEERQILQNKLDKIHDFFIEEIAENRNLPKEKVQQLATGEFFLGVEALEYGLIDELGDRKQAEQYFKKRLKLDEIKYAEYAVQPGLLEALSSIFSDYSFNIGQGIGAILKNNQKPLLLS